MSSIVPIHLVPSENDFSLVMATPSIRQGEGEGEKSSDLNFPQLTNNAVHDTLNGLGLIECYDIYKRSQFDDIRCIVRVGNRLNGYPGIVHGGIIALLFDNSFGVILFTSKIAHAVTANLNVNYRRPFRADNWIVLNAKIDKVEGRKLFMSATISDENGEILSDCTTLFITPKPKESPPTQLSTNEPTEPTELS
jgi:uncharacterized protein (TIGR00369 family)